MDDGAVDQALTSLRERAARYEPVEGRGVETGRLGRRRSDAHRAREGRAPLIVVPGDARRPRRRNETDTHEGVTVEIGAHGEPARDSTRS